MFDKNQKKTRIIFGVVLFIYAAYYSGRGIDVSDTTYALGNYQYMGKLDSMWMIATYISNIFGRLIISLPGAGTLYGAYVYATCLFAVFVTSVYVVLSRYINPFLVFIAEIVAAGLFWCPKVIFYNCLTYYLMATAILMLIYGLKNDRYRYLVIAGVILGFNVFVRFSNAIECLLIIGVWFYEIAEHHKPSELIKKTISCIAGYIAGFVIPLIFVVVQYDLDTYFDMIDSLFGMTQTAKDYGSNGVFRAVRYQVLDTFTDMKYLIFIAVIFAVVSIMIHRLFGSKDQIAARLGTAVKVCNVILLCALCLYFFKKGIYTTAYYEYSSIFKCANMFIILAFVCNLINVAGLLKSTVIFRTLSLMCLVQMIIAPMGTNNHMYAIMGNLFITAPVTFAIIYNVCRKLKDRVYGFAVASVCVYIAVIALVQSFAFHMSFSYVDGRDGSSLDTKVNSISRLGGLYTTKDRAEDLDGLYTYISDSGMTDHKVMYFGQDTAGLAYIMDMEPAINTLWPDLDSYTVSKYENALADLESEDDALIIMSTNLTYGANVDAKKQMLEDFIIDNSYSKIYENDMYTLYSNVGRYTP